MATVEQALAVAAGGRPVFPCNPTPVVKNGENTQDKSPLTSQGFKDATTDAKQIREWWARHPGALIGVPTGTASGLYVIDCEGEGNEWVRQNWSSLEPRRFHTTRRGLHLLYTGATELPGTVKKYHAGVDTRGAGGYIIWWPAEGLDTGGDQPGPLPQWWRAYIGNHHVAPKPPSADGAKIGEGGRNDFLSREAYRLRRTGASVESILVILSAINEERCDPPVDDGELRIIAGGKARIFPEPKAAQIFASAGAAPAGMLARVPEGTPGVSRFKPITAAELMARPTPDWLVDAFLMDGGLTMLFGPSNAGKSFALLDLACALERGQPWSFAKRRVVQCPVTYVAAESPASFISRCRAYVTFHGDGPMPRFVTVPPNMMNPGDVAELSAAIGQTGVVILDTLRATTPGGEENSSDDMGVFIDSCRTLQRLTGARAIIYAHHPGKDPEKGARGSSALYAGVDTELALDVVKDGARRLTVSKQRDGQTGDTLYFRLRPVILSGAPKPVSSCVVEHVAPAVEANGRKSRVSPEQRRLTSVFASLAPKYPEGVPFLVMVAAMSEACPDMRSDSIRRSINRAIEGEIISMDDQNRLSSPHRSSTDIPP